MTFECPECATPIEVEDEAFVVCNYCGTLLQNDGSDLERVELD